MSVIPFPTIVSLPRLVSEGAPLPTPMELRQFTQTTDDPVKLKAMLLHIANKFESSAGAAGACVNF